MPTPTVPPPGGIKGVLFDLDGTLIDTAPDLAAAIDETMQALGLATCGLARVRGWIGGGVPALVHKALTHGLGRAPREAELDSALDIAFARYARHNGTRSRAYPHVAATLRALHEAGRPLGCVTNKSAIFTVPLLVQMGWRGLFDAVVCGDGPAGRKPHAAPLRQAARDLGLASADLLLVGDSEHDADAARAAGMRMVAVSYGYHHGTHLAGLGAEAVISSLHELFELYPALRP